MVAQQLLRCRNIMLFCALMVGSGGGLLVAEAFSPKLQVAIAQPVETAPTDNSFLQGLLQLNQNFLTLQPQFRRFPTELEALDKQTKAFDAALFQDYNDKIQNLQQQISTLETQFGQFTGKQQQLAIKAELEKLQIIVQNLINISEPFVGGFNPDSIRQVQEFLDFFDRLGLTDSSYGFYGSVTQTELTTYLNQQLTNFSATLKQLNQIATQGAIAPDLATSINYLYTTLSLDSSSSSNVQTTIAQLEAENAILEKRIDNTHRIILFLPLIVMLPTTVLVFILFYYFGKIFQDKVSQPSNYQFSLNDIYGLEDELFAKLSEKYELKPRLIQRRNDPFAQKLISFANTTLEKPPATDEPSQPAAILDDSELTSDPDLVMDGDFGDDEDDSFPVNLPNVYDELVDQYNNDANHFQPEAIALAISHQESYLDDESEFTPMLLLNTDEAGDYWATKYKSLDYLMPRADLSVTTENYGNFKNIFICYGYQPDTVQKAKLLKPARVSSTEETDTWELVQQGIVVLHCI
ncbi:MAG: hypothetical protein HC799_04725 [Limnothrix sp. RL_2_0]|nr:hypothetical protein [Limnothrix sp. RL_2_0]